MLVSKQFLQVCQIKKESEGGVRGKMAKNLMIWHGMTQIHLKWRTVSHRQVAFEMLKLPVLDQKLCAIEGLQRVYLYTGFEYKKWPKNRQNFRH